MFLTALGGHTITLMSPKGFVLWLSGFPGRIKFEQNVDHWKVLALLIFSKLVCGGAPEHFSGPSHTQTGNSG